MWWYRSKTRGHNGLTLCRIGQQESNSRSIGSTTSAG